MTERADTTQLLLAANAGNATAFDDLYARLYDELRRIAHHHLLSRGRGETLNTAALVHEAYIRLVDQTRIGINDRAHFLALASRTMRFVMVDIARARDAQKRGGGAQVIPIDEVQIATDDRAADLLALDDALDRLANHDQRLGQLVEYRFFGGLTYEEIATATGQSIATVKRDWTRARTWLYHVMTS